MRVGVAAIVAIACCLPGLARSQSGAAGADVALAIPLHPDVMTVLQLPEDVVHAQILHRREFRFGFFASRLYVQPHPGTPAGVEALLDVETRTQRRRFRLRVVERAEDAMPEVTVHATAATPHGGAVAPEVPPDVPPAAPEPAASAPPQPQPSRAGHASVPQRAESVTEPANAATGSPRYDLAVHAVVSLGFTALDVAAHRPNTAFQSHRAAGVRLTGAPRETCWALEANISGEWIAGPMIYDETDTGRRLAVSGPWWRAEVGMRVQRRRRQWIPSAYAGLGVQAHLRRTEAINSQGVSAITNIMEDGVVLALGMGLQYRTRDVLLGVDFQYRRGGPDDYRSMSALWTVGYLLPDGD